MNCVTYPTLIICTAPEIFSSIPFCEDVDCVWFQIPVRLARDSFVNPYFVLSEALFPLNLERNSVTQRSLQGHLYCHCKYYISLKPGTAYLGQCPMSFNGFENILKAWFLYTNFYYIWLFKIKLKFLIIILIKLGTPLIKIIFVKICKIAFIVAYNFNFWYFNTGTLYGYNDFKTVRNIIRPVWSVWYIIWGSVGLRVIDLTWQLVLRKETSILMN